jgi:hypothetical protein
MRWTAVGTLFILLAAGAGPAHAQLGFGGQLSYGTESDLGLGGRVSFPLAQGVINIDGHGSFDYFFVGDSACSPGQDCKLRWWELHGMATVPVDFGESVGVYFGAGLVLARLSGFPDGSRVGNGTKAGLDGIVGVRFPSRTWNPFLEMRGVVGGIDQVVFTAGLEFRRAAGR